MAVAITIIADFFRLFKFRAVSLIVGN